jgi:hypothetical protein
MNGGILVASSLVEMFYRIVLKIINRKPFDWWGLRQLLLTDERAQIEHPRYLFNFLSHEFMSFGEALLFLFKFVKFVLQPLDEPVQEGRCKRIVSVVFEHALEVGFLDHGWGDMYELVEHIFLDFLDY